VLFTLATLSIHNLGHKTITWLLWVNFFQAREILYWEKDQPASKNWKNLFGGRKEESLAIRNIYFSI
jgi:hypothetical protein